MKRKDLPSEYEFYSMKKAVISKFIDNDHIMLQSLYKHLCIRSHPIRYSCYLGHKLNHQFSSYINYRNMQKRSISKGVYNIVLRHLLHYCEGEHVATGNRTFSSAGFC